MRAAGYFFAGQSDTGVQLSEGEEQEAYNPSEETLWLVYKWESLQPVSFYPAAEQPKLRSGLQFWAVAEETDTLRARCGMLRSAAQLLASSSRGLYVISHVKSKACH